MTDTTKHYPLIIVPQSNGILVVSGTQSKPGSGITPTSSRANVYTDLELFKSDFASYVDKPEGHAWSPPPTQQAQRGAGADLIAAALAAREKALAKPSPIPNNEEGPPAPTIS